MVIICLVVLQCLINFLMTLLSSLISPTTMHMAVMVIKKLLMVTFLLLLTRNFLI